MALVFLGAVVGGGFASGRELWLFFAGYGALAVWGACLAGAILAASGFAAVRWAASSPPGYGGLLEAVPRALARPFDALVFAFLFASLAVVLAGSGAMARDALGLPYGAGVMALALPLAACLAAREQGLLAANALLTPALACLIAGLSLWHLARGLPLGPGASPPAGAGGDLGWEAVRLPVPWWWSASLYAAYNGVIGVVALASLERARLRRRGAAWGGALGGLLAGGLAALATAALRSVPETSHDALPLLALAAQAGGLWVPAYLAALYAALFTTGLAAGFGMAARLPGRGAVRAWAPSLLLALALPLTRAGLPALVRAVYPLVAYASLALLAWAAAHRLASYARRRA